MCNLNKFICRSLTVSLVPCLRIKSIFQFKPGLFHALLQLFFWANKRVSVLLFLSAIVPSAVIATCVK